METTTVLSNCCHLTRAGWFGCLWLRVYLTSVLDIYIYIYIYPHDSLIMQQTAPSSRRTTTNTASPSTTRTTTTPTRRK